MITISLTDAGDLQVTQAMTSPAVYLDHWALRLISEDAGFSAAITGALEVRRGTLALSWGNLAEFLRVTVPDQTDRAEKLVQANLARLFLIEVDPFVVISREDKLLAGAPRRPPHADADLLRLLAKINPGSVAPFSVRGLFHGLIDPEVDQRPTALADRFIRSVQQLRLDYTSDPTLAQAVRADPEGPPLQAGTRFILRELIRPLVVDQRKQTTQNDVMDFFHTIVPVAYCDYVLLDKHWAAQVAQARSRFNQVGLSVPMAAIFSRGRTGVEQLLDELRRSDT